MDYSKTILKKAQQRATKSGICQLFEIVQILDLADEVGQFDNYIEKLHKLNFCPTTKQAEAMIAMLCDEIEDNANDSDPNDPDTWDEDEYQDNMSDLVNRSHEASEGMER